MNSAAGRWPIVAFGLLAVSLAACAAEKDRAGPEPAGSPTPGGAAAAAPATEPHPFYESNAEKYRIERAAIEGSGGSVTRVGRDLLVRTRDNQVVTLHDNLVDTDEFLAYRYVKTLPELRALLFEVFLHEGGGYLLVGVENGSRTFLEGLPVLSPDNQRFLISSMDLEAGFWPNLIKVWRLTPEGPKMEYSHDSGEEWGPSDVSWIDVNTIRFNKMVLDDDRSSEKIQGAMRLVYTDGKWEMREAAGRPGTSGTDRNR